MRLVLLYVVAALLSGCALQRDYITLDYAPTIGAEKVSDAENVHVHVTVADKREIKDRVSCKINGFGMEMAHIVSKNEVDKLVKEALSMELKTRGFLLDSFGSSKMFIEVEI
jgi:uncharacterized lipoprotein YajG